MIAELPLFLFSTLSGIAAGAYLAGAFVPAVRDTARKRWLYPLVCLVLLGCSLVCTLVHLGRPERFVNALANPGAMIAQEAYWAIAFGVFVLVDGVIAKVKGRTVRPVVWVGAVLALGLTVVTGMAYFVCYGVEAWSQPATIALFVAGDIAMGLALAAAFGSAAFESARFRTGLVAVEVVLAVALAAEAVAFWQADASVALPVAGLAVGPIASIVVVLAGKRLSPAMKGALVAGLTILGVALVRYGFYACA